MISETSCSFCHTMNPITEKYCAGCGHEAHTSRMQCKCPQCQPMNGTPRNSNSLKKEKEKEKRDETV